MRRIFTDEPKLGGWVSILAAILVLSTSILRYRRDHELEMPLGWSIVGALLLMQGVYRFTPKRKSTKAIFYCLEVLCVAAFIGVVVHFHT